MQDQGGLVIGRLRRRQDKPLVPFNRQHLRNGLLMTSSIVAVGTIGDVIQHGFTERSVLAEGGCGVVLAVGMCLSYWCEDNRDERDLRAFRRAFRTQAPPKVR
jgi:hypothetical protein